MSGHRVRADISAEECSYISATDGETLWQTDDWGAHAIVQVPTSTETRVLPIPSAVGQRMEVSVTDNDNDVVFVAPVGTFDGSDDTLTFSAAEGCFILQSFEIGGVVQWRLTYNNGGTLS